MSHYRDWCDPDPFDDVDDEQPSIVECKRCGKGGLTWEETDDGFILLVARTGEVHRCSAKDQAKGAFEPL